MMRFGVICSFLLVFYFLYGFYVNQYDVSVVVPQISREHSSILNDYKGVLNVHTELSSGSAPASSVVAAARLSSLDFIMFTDLNTFNISTTSETYQDDLLVLVAGKYSYLDSRLIYYSSLAEPIGHNLGEAQVKLSDLLSQKTGASKDTLTILTHPYKAGYSWQGEIPSGLDGFELLNLKSLLNRAWEESKLSTFWSLAIYPFNPKVSFLRLYTEPRDEIALLDKVSQERRILVYGGTEATARAIPLSNYLIRFPSYRRTFEIMSNHILLKSELTGNLASDKQKIFNALKNGNFYIALDMLGDPKGFVATIEGDGPSQLMGNDIKFKKNLTLEIELPSKPRDFFEILILKNGKVVHRSNDPKVSYPIPDPGVYRVQVRVAPMLPLPDAKKWFSWIYTNPFYVNP